MAITPILVSQRRKVATLVGGIFDLFSFDTLFCDCLCKFRKNKKLAASKAYSIPPAMCN